MAAFLSSAPRDEYLIYHYLRRKIYGFPLPRDASAVPDDDLYGDKEPWEIWSSLRKQEKDEILIFSRLKYVTITTAGDDKHPRLIRRIGAGTWVRDEDSDKKYIEVLGRYAVMKRFRYENKAARDHDGRWVMEEYQYLGREGDYYEQVLCRLKRAPRTTGGGGGRKRKMTQRVAEERKSGGSGIVIKKEGDLGQNSDHHLQQQGDNSGIYTTWALEFAEELRNGEELIPEPEIFMVDNPSGKDIMGWEILKQN